MPFIIGRHPMRKEVIAGFARPARLGDCGLRNRIPARGPVEPAFEGSVIASTDSGGIGGPQNPRRKPVARSTFWKPGCTRETSSADCNEIIRRGPVSGGASGMESDRAVRGRFVFAEI